MMAFSLSKVYITLTVLLSIVIANILFILCKDFLLDLQKQKNTNTDIPYSMDIKPKESNNIFNFLSNTIFFGVGWLESKENSNTKPNSNLQHKTSQSVLEKLSLDSQCAINNKDDFDFYFKNCDEWIEKQNSKKILVQTERNIEQSQKGDALKEIIKGSLLIKAIEYLLILTLGVQLFLTMYTFFLEKSPIFDKYVFHLSDFAINTPPILGVMANLASFALLVTKSAESSGNIMDYFSVYFFDAVITTLIGAIFYIICLGLKVFILPRVEDNVV